MKKELEEEIELTKVGNGPGKAIDDSISSLIKKLTKQLTEGIEEAVTNFNLKKNLLLVILVLFALIAFYIAFRYFLLPTFFNLLEDKRVRNKTIDCAFDTSGKSIFGKQSKWDNKEKSNPFASGNTPQPWQGNIPAQRPEGMSKNQWKKVRKQQKQAGHQQPGFGQQGTTQQPQAGQYQGGFGQQKQAGQYQGGFGQQQGTTQQPQAGQQKPSIFNTQQTPSFGQPTQGGGLSFGGQPAQGQQGSGFNFSGQPQPTFGSTTAQQPQPTFGSTQTPKSKVFKLSGDGGGIKFDDPTGPIDFSFKANTGTSNFAGVKPRGRNKK